MSDSIERLLQEAIRTRRPVLVNPSEDEIRATAKELQASGRLICTGCRRPILDEEFTTQRIQFGGRLQALAHLHRSCESGFRSAMEESS